MLLFGAAGGEACSRLRRRWGELVDVAEAADDDHRTGAVLIRPDGYVSFRANATDAPALAAIEQHLDSYLIAS